MAFAEGNKFSSLPKLKEHKPKDANFSIPTQGRIVVVGLPGAFTGACNDQVPKYQEHAAEFEKKGVKSIYFVTVNDLMVVQSWKTSLDITNHNIHILADDTGEFTKEVGQLFDASELLGNHRSWRYVAIIEDGTVKKLLREQAFTDVKETLAENVLKHLS